MNDDKSNQNIDHENRITRDTKDIEGMGDSIRRVHGRIEVMKNWVIAAMFAVIIEALLVGATIYTKKQSQLQTLQSIQLIEKLERVLDKNAKK